MTSFPDSNLCAKYDVYADGGDCILEETATDQEYFTDGLCTGSDPCE